MWPLWLQEDTRKDCGEQDNYTNDREVARRREEGRSPLYIKYGGGVEGDGVQQVKQQKQGARRAEEGEAAVPWSRREEEGGGLPPGRLNGVWLAEGRGGGEGGGTHTALHIGGGTVRWKRRLLGRS